uniref:hypothetical protein n=1 Tax=Pseudomonas aeruginosa TaxID=287 RepID=UPI003CEA72CA
MSLTDREKQELLDALGRLTPAQQQWVKAAIHSFGTACTFRRAPNSDVVTDAVLASLADRLL